MNNTLDTYKVVKRISTKRHAIRVEREREYTREHEMVASTEMPALASEKEQP